jgi:hypothetical protein
MYSNDLDYELVTSTAFPKLVGHDPLPGYENMIPGCRI